MKKRFIDKTFVTCSIIAVLASILSCEEDDPILSPKRPAQVRLSFPIDRATRTALIPIFSWQAVDGAKTYALQVSTNSDLSSPVIDQSGLTETSYSITRLQDSTVYYWRVRAANGAGDGPWSEIRSFTTILALPPQVSLIAPADRATRTALIPIFSWQGVDVAETYALQVSINSDLASPVIDQSGLIETSYSSTTLQVGTGYYWRVRAANDLGDGPWSEIRSFTTLLAMNPPPQVSLTTPAEGATGIALTPIFSWQGVDEAETYTLQVSINSDLSSPVIDQSDLIETDYEVRNTLQIDTVYYWRVRAANHLGDGPWSGTNSFTTIDPPPQVILITPPDTLGLALPLTFSWQGVDEADTYDLQVALTFDLASPVIDQSGLIETSYPSATLQTNTVYFWRVRARNSDGPGPWSKLGAFTTVEPPPQVSLNAPADGATEIALIPIFSWQEVDEAETYALQVSINSDLASPVIDQSGLIETSYSSTTLQVGTGYYWRVRAANDAGDGPWSGTNSFTTLAVMDVPPQVILINSTGTGIDTTFSWQRIDEAETYTLQVSTHNNLSSLVINESGLTKTSYSSTRLQDSTVYYWRVRAANHLGDGPWSGINSFTKIIDTDEDNVSDPEDIDDDNDGLIEINNLEDLDNIRHNLAGTSYKTNATDPGNTNGAPTSGLKGYELARDLDFADPASYASGMVNAAWTMGSGWLPIGDNSTRGARTRFTGILEGNGHKITNLMISNNLSYIGLFGYISSEGEVRNLGLEGAVADYTGNSDSEIYIGLLAGFSTGSIDSVHTSGRVNGGDGNNDNVGGLVGYNFQGRITASYATGNAGDGAGDFDNVGGLVGQNDGGMIMESYATGNAGGSGDNVGGLVGRNDRGTIMESYATGSASGGAGNEDNVGGLVGFNGRNSRITVSYAMGNASGGAGNEDNVGGLVGYSFEGTITASYATGSADGGDGDFDNVGGLVGRNDSNSTIMTCYATDMANGGDGNNDRVGGLVGYNFEGTIRASYAMGEANDGKNVGGLVGRNEGRITASYAMGNASGGDDGFKNVGGLVGRNDRGTIMESYATGSVAGGDGDRDNVGGLVGYNFEGRITASYAMSNASGGDGDRDSVGGLVGENDGGMIMESYAMGNASGGDGDNENVGGLVGYSFEGTITASYAMGNASGGDGDNENVGGLVGENFEGPITASYATGSASGGDDGNNNVGGLVGENSGLITACYATGPVAGSDDSDDNVGGLVGENSGLITACYATGSVAGGDGDNDDVGGLVGYNFEGTITASYATGSVAGGDGDSDIVGGLVGFNFGTITACHGFGTRTGGENRGVSRSDDASTVDSASAITEMNSSMNGVNRWPARVWDFGTDSQVPVLKWITGYDSSGATEAEKYLCDEALLPAGRRCGDIIPGQER